MDKAVWEYNIFNDGEKILVAVSGGADSIALLDLLQLRIPVYADKLELFAVYVDMGFGHGQETRCQMMQRFFKNIRVQGKILRTTAGPYAHSAENRENPCFLCTRIRRRNIFEAAEELGCTKIAFGHHKDDVTETLMLNMIFNREISTMIPNLAVFQGKYRIVRPLLYVEETLLKKYCRERRLLSFDQECPTDGHSKRQYIKDMLDNLEKDFKGARENIFHSMKRVKVDYLL